MVKNLPANAETQVQCLVLEDPTSHRATRLLSQLLSLCSRTSSVQSVSRVRRFVTPWTAARQASLSLVSSQVLTHTSTGETQTQFWLSLCRVSGL